MCTRYSATKTQLAFDYAFSITPQRSRFNIAPTQNVPVIRNAKEGGREMVMARFGLIPVARVSKAIRR
jgi:putative SOS response-associated peptidase YedK